VRPSIDRYPTLNAELSAEPAAYYDLTKADTNMEFWRFARGDDWGPLLAGEHDWRLVLLSLMTASLGAFVALAVVKRVNALHDPVGRRVWEVVGAVSMGAGVWAMHFTAMLAFTLPVSVGYVWWITILSVLPKLAGGRWHPYRRLFATELAHVPAEDCGDARRLEESGDDAAAISATDRRVSLRGSDGGRQERVDADLTHTQPRLEAFRFRELESGVIGRLPLIVQN
jgi:hypothetical protein